MRQRKHNLDRKKFICPATGKACLIGATILLTPPDIMQMPLIDADEVNERGVAMAEAVEEAERHG